MDLSLSQVEYTEAGAVVGRGCVHVVPGSHNKTGQKVAVGNNLGELRLFGIHQRTRAVEDTYKISAFPRTPVNCMRVMQIPDSDKVAIFVGGQAAVGTCGDVLAFSRRNKSPFLDFTTHLTDPVSHLDLYQHDMFAASSNMFTHFYNCEVDHGFYAPPHSITDVSYASLDGVIHPIIISKDRLLRILSYDVDATEGYGQKDTIFEVELPSQPQCLLPYCEAGQPRKNMLYGTKDGRLGMTAISRPIKQRFCLDNDKKKGSIDTLATYDLDEDGVSEIVVGRSDGRVDVFRVERGESKPTLCAEHSFTESVTAVSCGNVGSAEEHEVVLATYSGRIFGLRTGTSKSLVQASVAKDGAEVAGDHANRVAALRQQISDLEYEVTEKRARREDDQVKAVDAVEYIADPYIELHDDFSFQENEANYVLTIHAQVSLDFILLRSDTTMDVVDLDKNTVLSSQCAPDPENKTMVAHTFRCQLNTRHVELKIRPIEGQQGTLSVMVAPAAPMSMYKVAKELSYEIRPLCLHCLTHMDDIDRPLSSLKYAGSASVDDIHGILYKCLARLGERPNRTSDGEAISLIYTSSITGTVVRITYKDNELLLESDNVSTLSIFKEYLTKLILEKRLRFACTPEINLESVTWMLRLIHEKVCPQLALSQKLLLWQALKEVELSEGTGSVTSPEYKEILENGESLQKEAEVATSNSMLERLYGTITDLYIDYYRMEGIDSKKHINVLVQLLDEYDLDRLLEFFMKDPNDPALWGEQ